MKHSVHQLPLPSIKSVDDEFQVVGRIDWSRANSFDRDYQRQFRGDAQLATNTQKFAST
jgi:hypothetical protein